MFLLAQVAPPVEATEETVWQLQTHWTWAPWFTVLFIVAVVLGIAWLYARESSPAGTAYRVLLGALRLTTIGLVLLMLSELLLSATREGLPRLVVLIDHSASMGLHDDEDEASRLDRTREFLVAGEGALFDAWKEKYVVELAVIADGSERVAGETASEWLENLSAVETTGATSNRSRLGDALATALDERKGPPPAAVVLLTDGRTTAGRSLDEARVLARHRGTPIYAIGLGPTTAPPDLGLTDLLADEIALVGDLVAIGVTLEATGMEGQTAKVTVHDVAAGTVTTEQEIEITSNGFTESIQLLVRPEQEGKVTYRVEVETAGAERDEENNRLEHVIDVRDDQIRVLLAAGYPNYEFRYLKNLLERDTTFELASYLQEADLEHAEQDATAVAQLPLKTDDLDEFDVIVLIDLNPRLLPPRWWQNVERHVVEQGGGLVLVAGPRHFPWQYASVGEVADLAPIDVRSAGRSGGAYHNGYNLQLTPLGEGTASMQLGATSAESTELWRGLPPFYWFCEAGQAKPAAQVLATHPTARTAEGVPVPLAALQYVGAGRVLYHGFDSSYRWRFRVGDVFFARYWGQSLRHLARSKVTAGDDGAELIVERGQFDVGEPVRLQLRLGKASTLDSAKAELLLEAEGQPRRKLALAPSRVSPKLWQATASDLPPGDYRVTLGEPRLPEPPRAVEFEVVAPPGELADITMNEPVLRSLAEGTYGKFYTLDEAESLAGDLPLGDNIPMEVLPPVELWNGWWMLLVITWCLTTEWILRKRRAML